MPTTASAARTESTSRTPFVGPVFAASEGLATVVRGLIDRPALSKALGLRDDQRIVLGQSVGYPKSAE